jgi:hypothetical protein
MVVTGADVLSLRRRDTYADVRDELFGYDDEDDDAA